MELLRYEMTTERKLGNLYGYNGGNFAGNIYDKRGLCPALLTMQGGGKQPMVIDDCRICAMRGRGDGLRQRIEVGEQDVSNALTTAQKDNLLLERNMGGRHGDKQLVDIYNKNLIDGGVCGTITAHGNISTTTCGTFGIVEQTKKQDCKVVGGLGEKKSNGGTQFYQQDRVYYGDIQPAQPAQLPGGSYNFLLEENRNGFFEAAEKTAKEGNAQPGDTIDAFNRTVNKSGIAPTVTTRPEGKKTAILPVTENYRIRKLTPRECWRLMGFTDIDFDKAASVCSNSQLYKQAGNSIVRQVLMAIFSQMNIKGVKPWNEMSDDERRSRIGRK